MLNLFTVLQLAVGGAGIIIGLISLVYPILGRWKKTYPGADEALLRMRQRWNGVWCMTMGLVSLMDAFRDMGWLPYRAGLVLLIPVAALEIVSIVFMFRTDKKLREAKD